MFAQQFNQFTKLQIMRYLFTLIICYSLISISAIQAQSVLEDEISKPINLTGPRLGFTYLGNVYTNAINNDPTFDRMYGKDRTLYPFITQFGWQFETRFFTLPNGSCGIIEFVPLLGGLDQNVVIPSLTVMIGARLSNGIEFGMGPNVNLSGTSVSLVAGYTFERMGINFPVNIAITPTPEGVRGSLLLGFNKHE